MYKKISDYGIIGDLHTIALIGLDGSIDWLCFPHLDSPSIFGALLDDKKGGRFSISPKDEWDSVAEYIPGTNILQTRFRTRTGVLQVTDFMPVCSCEREEPDEKIHELYRCIESLKGNVRAVMDFDPRFDYARAETKIEKIGNSILAQWKNESVILLSSHPLISGSSDLLKAEWDISEGEKIWLHLSYGSKGLDRLDVTKADKALNETASYWRNWVNRNETGRVLDLGSYSKMVERSALVLKLLYYEPAGTIAAAATTSLPEEIGGTRNWDYRYTWLRDASFTLQALFDLGHLSETEGYIKWIEKLISEHGAGRMQIMYGLMGQQELPEELLTHLDGYKGSRPVRIGNGASRQRQLDIYGELMDAALKLSDYVGKIDIKLWPFLRDICDYVSEHWHEKDSGIWEVRDGPYHFVYSKVMCWVALDRGMTISRRYGFPADMAKWKKTAGNIMKEVLDKGWNEKKQAFVQHYETDALDSSNLLMPILGFLPFDDPRVVSTLEAIERELGDNGFLYRYNVDDGLPGNEGVFLLCTFWLIDNLIALGRLDEAEKHIHRIEGTANHLGLFSEEYDVTWKEMLGNFPQAFTHIGYINSVIKLIKAKTDLVQEESKEQQHTIWKGLFSSKILLNNGRAKMKMPSSEIVSQLKRNMNVLRGAFFDTPKSRVAYEKMKGSEPYKEYLELSYRLKDLDLRELTDRNEKIAFWINLYNVIVIHAVIELGIRDSVKEVINFFKRVCYQIGGMSFTPYEIEHGILRGNRRPPYALFPVFGQGDSRRSQIIDPLDPRIHFALVCASSSCPPIDVYTAGNLQEELEISGRSFLNTGGIAIDIGNLRVSLSRIFKWYAKDFGEKPADRLRFIAPYIYDAMERKVIWENADILKIDYQDYDWRLNRY